MIDVTVNAEPDVPGKQWNDVPWQTVAQDRADGTPSRVLSLHA